MRHYIIIIILQMIRHEVENDLYAGVAAGSCAPNYATPRGISVVYNAARITSVDKRRCVK